MIASLDRLTVSIVAAGTIACVLTAAILRPAPFPERSGAQWVAVHRSWTAPAAGVSYSLDTVVAGARRAHFDARPQSIGPGDGFGLNGWAFDPNFRRSADRFVYRVDGGPWRDAAYHISRPDVAAAVHVPKAADSGFDLEIAPGALAPGRHTIELATMDGPSPAVPLPQTLTVDVRAR